MISKDPNNTGYIYILWNENFGKYIKIGYTYKDPKTRAKQLSSGTGVPGHYSVNYWWRLSRPEYYERRVFNRLREYRRSGEFFEIRTDDAIKIIDGLFEELGVNDVFSMDDKTYSDPKPYFEMVKRYNEWVEKAQIYDPSSRQGQVWRGPIIRDLLSHMKEKIEKYRHLHTDKKAVPSREDSE